MRGSLHLVFSLVSAACKVGNRTRVDWVNTHEKRAAPRSLLEKEQIWLHLDIPNQNLYLKKIIR